MQSVDFRTLFPVINRHCWLNHAAISAWPKPVINAARQFVDINERQGALDYEAWLAKEEQLRTQIAQFIHAPTPLDISLLRNTSEGLNIIAKGIDWHSGDEIVLPANEFPSNRLPWDQLQTQGVKVIPVILNHDAPEQSLIDAVNPKTRLIALSSVQFDTGLRLDLAPIVQAARRSNALISVDGIQQLGALPINVQTLDIDFLVCGTHKWLMAPEGMGFLWTRENIRAKMKVALPGWRMYTDPFNFCRTEWAPPSCGRRFETGTVNMFGIHTLSAAIKLLEDLNPAITGEALLDRTDYLIERLEHIDGIELITPRRRQQRAGIVCIKANHLNPDCLLEHLAADGIHIAKRGTNLRISPHFYTPFEQLDLVIAKLSDQRWCDQCSV